MKFFSKEETISVIIIFAVLIGVSIPNFITSIMRARDQTRRDDMGSLFSVLAAYHEDFGVYPMSQDGMILACKKEGDEVRVGPGGKLLVNLVPCMWGKDSLVDLTPGSSKVYLKLMPRDPDFDKGVTYTYLSDGSAYQIFASFEIDTEPEYDPAVVSRNIMCGTKICNMGRHGGCVLAKSLEQCSQERRPKK